MTIIYIDNKEYQVNKFDNLLQVCLSLGFDIPYFCWHPALGSVGSCRQCVVKQYKDVNDNFGKLVISCMTSITDNAYFSIFDEEAKIFRKNIIELLMINHPHDCPVCEEGGSCHLQDMTVMVGHNIRRYRFPKKTYYNQYLGPFISHEMNRCISCYRCVRFYRDYADGNDFGVYGSNNNIYFGRINNGILENEFSGNLVDICPTGVFTDKTYSNNYVRKWDMQFSPSICHQCSIGCNISPGERYGQVRRIENRYNGSINHYFLCDRGRFGYDYVNLKNRPYQPVQYNDNNWTFLNAEQAVYKIAHLLRKSSKLIGIGSPRASIESNFMLRQLVGADNFYTGLSQSEQDQLELIIDILSKGGIYTPSLREIESYDAILLLGEDVTQTGARMALSIRQAIKNKAKNIAVSSNINAWHSSAVLNIGKHSKYPLFITSIDKTCLDDISLWNYYASVNDQARFGFAIAHAIDNKAPIVSDFDINLSEKINLIAQALLTAEKPLIISGSNNGCQEIISAAANIAFSLKNCGKCVGISFVASEVNSMGLSMIGGRSLDEALSQLETNSIDTIIILENDLYRHASHIRVDNALLKTSNVIVLDHQHTTIQNKSSIVLSAASFAEGDGTVINNEGRAQRFFQVYDPAYYNHKLVILESWRWLYALNSVYLYDKLDWSQFDDIVTKLIKVLPQFSGIEKVTPNANFRIHGQKLAREPNRYSGRTSMCSNVNVHESRISQDIDSMFTFSMEGDNLPKSPRQHIAFAWYPGWNSLQAWNKFQDEVGGHLFYGDPGVRLLVSNNRTLNYYKNIPKKNIKLSENLWYVAPYWYLFGSDETSQLSSVIQQRMSEPYAIISKDDMIKLEVDNNTIINLKCLGLNIKLPVKISYILNSGQIGLPLGFPGIPPILAGVKIDDLHKAIS